MKTHQQLLLPGIGSAWRALLIATAVALSAVYVAWNLYWLAQARLAPSLWMTLTGLPCPTTGVTRSLLALARGDWLESVRYNPLSVVFVLLLLGSSLQLAHQAAVGRRLSLSRIWAWGWGVSLGVGWIYKLVSDPAYW